VWNHQLTATNWFKYGDTCSKQFFDFHRIGRKRMLLKELIIDDGEITGQVDLAHYVRSFYVRLYASKAHAPGTTEAREECWGNTPTRVSTEMNNELVRKFTFKEVQDATLQCQRTKHQGAMAFPLSFSMNSQKK
jgi:hypothetical protein